MWNVQYPSLVQTSESEIPLSDLQMGKFVYHNS